MTAGADTPSAGPAGPDWVSRLGRWPIAGVALAVTVLLTFWSRNAVRVGPEGAWPTMLAVVIIAGLVTALLYAVSRSAARAGIGAAMIAAYLFYAPVLLEATGLNFYGQAAAHLIVAALLVFAYRKIPATGDAALKLSGQANLISLLLLAIGAVPLAIQVIQLESGRVDPREVFADLDGSADADSPDVWHIIVDRYAASRTLAAQYGYDNSAFLDGLRGRGFTVSDNAFSNYQRTGHSVASTMNASMLDPLANRMAGQAGDWVPLYRSMRDSAAIRQFGAMQYSTVFAGSWWEPTRLNHNAKETYQYRTLPQLGRLLINHSAIGFWLREAPIPYLGARGDQCRRVTAKFNWLAKVAQREDRKHVFAHFLIPHPPFVVNADGSCRPLDEAVETSRRDNYIAQLEYTNGQALQLIDAITAGPRPAVIVLHSDEGPWPEPYVGNEHGLGTDPVRVPWTKLTQPQLEEKFAILLAVRTPDGSAPATMPKSPVQIYPALLRDYFNSDAAIPASRHAVFESDEALYTFSDVAARLDAAE